MAFLSPSVLNGLEIISHEQVHSYEHIMVIPIAFLTAAYVGFIYDSAATILDNPEPSYSNTFVQSARVNSETVLAAYFKKLLQSM